MKLNCSPKICDIFVLLAFVLLSIALLVLIVLALVNVIPWAVFAYCAIGISIATIILGGAFALGKTIGWIINCVSLKDNEQKLQLIPVDNNTSFLFNKHEDPLNGLLKNSDTIDEWTITKKSSPKPKSKEENKKNSSDSEDEDIVELKKS